MLGSTFIQMARSGRVNINPDFLLRNMIAGLALCIFGLTGCGGGQSSAGTAESVPAVPSQPAPTPAPTPSPAPAPAPAPTPSPSPTPTSQDNAFGTPNATSRFLTQTTFGPTPDDISALTGTSASEWFLAQSKMPVVYHLPRILEYQEDWLMDVEELSVFNASTTTFTFWRDAITADDQLRQRMAFALSQLLVVSNFGGELLSDVPEAIGYHQDMLLDHAFGNYRDLLEAVTYSPAMGYYLTYMGNQKADPDTGRMPDENYAREILQLFSIGLLELDPDGTPKTDAQGQPIELYNNDDITGLARVFTGLDMDISPYTRENISDEEFDQIVQQGFSRPMLIVERHHSQREKRFLGMTIPAGTGAVKSIDMALDHIMQQPSVAPFISRQLIQRFVTSHPSADYVERVASTFETGRYTLPNGAQVGEGRKGDLQATLAAILFDHQARAVDISQSLGKVREPVLRFTHWARAFNVENVAPEFVIELWDTQASEALGQHPYRSRSVFNFYRPGYVSPGTQTGAQGLTMPELQIMNASTTPGYMNFMTHFISAGPSEIDIDELSEAFEEEGVYFNPEDAEEVFAPDYSYEVSLAANPDALLDWLDSLLTYGTLSPHTRQTIINTISALPAEQEQELSGAEMRVMFAILMVMTSPDYLVQQ